MKKFLFSMTLCLLAVLSITGCGKETTKKVKDSNQEKVEEKKLKAKCSAIECIQKIEPENTVEEVNEIIGVDGVLTNENYNYYEYDLGNDEKITLKYYKGTTATIEADFDKKDIADKKVDLSNLNDLKPMVNAGITYDNFKKQIGNVDGVLVEKSKTSVKYMWVSKKGGNVRASFRTSDNMCTFFTGLNDPTNN